MSRAFVKESDGSAGEELPELALSPHRNLVTREGLALLQAALQRLEVELSAARAAGDRATAARCERDLRYWVRRRASAELVELPVQHAIVRFGSRVLLELADGRERRFRIVGEDEADPAAGLLSYVSPFGERLLGAGEGEEVAGPGGPATLLRIE